MYSVILLVVDAQLIVGTLEFIAKLAIVTLFWGLVMIMGRFYLGVLARGNGHGSLSQNAALNICTSFLTGLALILFFAFFASLLQLPASIVSVIFVALLIPPFVGFKLRYVLPQKLTLLSVALVLVFAVVFVVSSIKTGYMSGDAWVHISHANSDLVHGFSFSDPYFPGTVDSRYPINAIHSALTLASDITGLSVIDVWYFSNGFFALFASLALYSLVWTVFKKRSIALAVVLGSIILSNMGYPLSLYPNFIAQAALMVLVTVYIRREAGYKKVLFIIAFVLAFIHIGLAAMAAALLLLTWLLEAVFIRGSLRKNIYLIGVVGVLLALPLFVYLFLDNNASQAFLTIGIKESMYYDFYGLKAFRIFGIGEGLTTLITMLSLLGVASYLLVSKNIGNKKYILLASLFFVLFTSSNPLIYPILEQLMPPWSIKRFGVANVLYEPVYLGVGIIIALAYLSSKYARGRIRPRIISGALLSAVILYAGYLAGGPAVVVEEYTKTQSRNRAEYLAGKSIGQFMLPNDANKAVTDKYVGYILPATTRLSPTYVAEGHMTPTLKYDAVKQCNDWLQAGVESREVRLPHGYVFIIDAGRARDYVNRENEYRLIDARLIRTKKYYVFESVSSTQLPIECRKLGDIMEP